MQISNIYESIIVMKSIGTRFFMNFLFHEAVQKTRSTCFMGFKNTPARFLNIT